MAKKAPFHKNSPKSSPRVAALPQLTEPAETYQVEGIKGEIAEQICQAMEHQQINKGELARRVGKSPAYINKVLRGSANFTLESLARIARALSYQLEPKLNAAPAASIVSGLREKRQPANHSQSARITETTGNQAQRQAVRHHLAAAERWANEMMSDAQTGNLMELSNSGFALTAVLDELWALRDEREADWGDLLNLLQGALAKEEFERFSTQQCTAIRKIITDHLAGGYVEIDDLERSIRLLREAGLDPWKGISGAISE
jgi:transcriptional regulator with XRE-family HTH domain